MAGLATARIAKDQNERAIETLQLLAELQVTESAERRAETKKKLEGKTGELSFNTKSALTVLQETPRKKYEEYEAPTINMLQAISMYETKRKQAIDDMYKEYARMEQKEERIAPELLYPYSTEPVIVDGFSTYVRNVTTENDRTERVQWSDQLTIDHMSDVVVQDPTGDRVINLYETLSALIDRATEMHLSKDQLDRFFLLFVKTYIPNQYNAVRSLTGPSLFESLLNLTSHHALINSLMNQLDNVERQPHQGLQVCLGTVRSICAELLRLQIPGIEPKKTEEKLDQVCQRLIPSCISLRTRKAYYEYVKQYRICFNKSLTYQQRLDWVADLELDVDNWLERPVKIKRGQIPASLFWSKVVTSGMNMEQAEVEVQEDDWSENTMQEFYYTNPDEQWDNETYEEDEVYMTDDLTNQQGNGGNGDPMSPSTNEQTGIPTVSKGLPRTPVGQGRGGLQTRSSSTGLSQPLHSWGNQQGVTEAQSRQGKPGARGRGAAGRGSPGTSRGRGWSPGRGGFQSKFGGRSPTTPMRPSNIYTSSPSNTTAYGGQPGGAQCHVKVDVHPQGSQITTRTSPSKSQDGTNGFKSLEASRSRTMSPSGQQIRESPERGRSPVRKNFSPTTGRSRLYRRTSTGDYKSLDRSRIFRKSPSSGMRPRTPSRSPSRVDFSRAKTPEDIPRSHCQRCFNRKAENGKPGCTTNQCQIYLKSPIAKAPCSCGKGFHRREFCNRVTPSNSPSRFNQALN